jgi:hypothetical protein
VAERPPREFTSHGSSERLSFRLVAQMLSRLIANIDRRPGLSFVGTADPDRPI